MRAGESITSALTRKQHGRPARAQSDRGRERAELGLHFETRDPRRNQRLLEYVADELPFLKEVLGTGLEAEPWDKGWTRVYLTRPLTRLDPDEQADLATVFAELIETLEPLRREAIEATAELNP
jgi:hypothetical protein